SATRRRRALPSPPPPPPPGSRGPRPGGDRPRGSPRGRLAGSGGARTLLALWWTQGSGDEGLPASGGEGRPPPREASMELTLVLAVSVLGLISAGLLAKWVLSRDQGPEEMRRISGAIRQGAEAFLRRQNLTIILIALPLAALIFVLYAFVRTRTQYDPASEMTMALWTTLSFALGAACSLIAGYVGMWISIRTNLRTAAAARTTLNGALQAALRGGAVSGLLVVAMSLLGVGGLYGIAKVAGATKDVTQIPL